MALDFRTQPCNRSDIVCLDFAASVSAEVSCDRVVFFYLVV